MKFLRRLIEVWRLVMPIVWGFAIGAFICIVLCLCACSSQKESTLQATQSSYESAQIDAQTSAISVESLTRLMSASFDSLEICIYDAPDAFCPPDSGTIPQPSPRVRITAKSAEMRQDETIGRVEAEQSESTTLATARSDIDIHSHEQSDASAVANPPNATMLFCILMLAVVLIAVIKRKM